MTRRDGRLKTRSRRRSRFSVLRRIPKGKTPTPFSSASVFFRPLPDRSSTRSRSAFISARKSSFSEIDGSTSDILADSNTGSNAADFRAWISPAISIECPEFTAHPRTMKGFAFFSSVHREHREKVQASLGRIRTGTKELPLGTLFFDGVVEAAPETFVF